MSDEEYDVYSEDETSERTKFGSELVQHNHFVSRIFVLDKNSNEEFLVDTGSALSLLPPKFKTNICGVFESTLSVVSGSQVRTYGEVELDLDFDLDRHLTWIFLVSDVEQAILGADFLHYHDLLVDIRRCRLIDFLTKKVIPGVNSSDNSEENVSSEVVSSDNNTASQTPNKFSYDGWQTADCLEFERDQFSVATKTLFKSKNVSKNLPIVGNSVLFSSLLKSRTSHLEVKHNVCQRFDSYKIKEEKRNLEHMESVTFRATRNEEDRENKETCKSMKQSSMQLADKPLEVKIKESGEIEIIEYEKSNRQNECIRKSKKVDAGKILNKDKEPNKSKKSACSKTDGFVESKEYNNLMEPVEIKINEYNVIEEARKVESKIKIRTEESKNSEPHEEIKTKKEICRNKESILDKIDVKLNKYEELNEPVEIKVDEFNIIEESRKIKSMKKRKGKGSENLSKSKVVKTKEELCKIETSDDEGSNDYDESREIDEPEEILNNELSEVTQAESLIELNSIKYKDQISQTPLDWAKDWRTYKSPEITLNCRNNNVSTQTVFSVPFVGGKLKHSLIQSIRTYEADIQKKRDTLQAAIRSVMTVPVTNISEPSAKKSRVESSKIIPHLTCVDPRIRSDSVQPTINNTLPLPAFYHKDPIFNIDKTRTLPLFGSSRPRTLGTSLEGPASKRLRLNDAPQSNQNTPPACSDSRFSNASSVPDSDSNLLTTSNTIPNNSLQPYNPSSECHTIIQPSYVPPFFSRTPHSTVDNPNTTIHYNTSSSSRHVSPTKNSPVSSVSFNIREYDALYENKKWFDSITPAKWLKQWTVHNCREVDVHANNEIATQTIFSPLTVEEYKIVQEERTQHFLAKAQARKELMRQTKETGLPMFDSTTTIKLKPYKKKVTITPSVPPPPKSPLRETVFSEFECIEFSNGHSSDEDNLVIDERNSERLQTPKRWLHKGWVQWDCKEFYVIDSTTKSTQTLFRKPMTKEEKNKLY